MRRLEIAPGALGRTEFHQRRPWISLRQKNGTRRGSGNGIHVCGVNLGGDPGELVGRTPRGRNVFALEHHLDTRWEQP